MTTSAPESPSRRFSTLLTRLLSNEDWERALDVAREWLAADPESVQAHLAAGQALVNLKRHAQARTHLEKALAGNPQNSFVHRLLSIVCFHGQRFADADEHVRQALALQPNDAMHWYHLAWMRYQQGAREAAAKHATRALELQPENANILNLLALCQRQDGQAQLAQYRRALELDPENSAVHNNVGTYYLNNQRDYAAAEASFRQALRLNPSDKTAQNNLFTVLRRRDRVYQVLSLPRTLVSRLSWRGSNAGWLTRILLVAAWLTIGRYLLVAVVAWFALVYPLVKAYEYLTLGDIRAQAGVIAARQGGLLGYRRWPFAVRFGIFAAFTLLFWGAVFGSVRAGWVSPELLIGVVFLAAFIFLCRSLGRSWQQMRRWFIVRRGEKKLHRQMNPTDRPAAPAISSHAQTDE
jgi:tetratricopeptide (TPR) repeat protein